MKFITYWPTHHNDGSEVDPATQEALIARAWQTFGGCTLLGPATGVWAEGETIYREAVMRVEIACDNAQYNAAREYVLWCGKQLKQLAMYFEVQHFDGVEIVKVTD